MFRVLSFIALMLWPALIFAEPAAAPDAPQAPSDGEVIISGDESDDSSESNPSGRQEEPAGPMVDSKVFQSWSRFGLGTSVEINTTFSVAGQSFSMDAVSTLKEKKDDAVTIESSFKNAPGGQSPANEIDKQDAKVPEGSEYAPTGFRGKMKEAGAETLTVDGKTYECKIMEFDGADVDGSPVTGKIWVCDEVPGTHLKGLINMNSDGQQMVIELSVTKINVK